MVGDCPIDVRERLPADVEGPLHGDVQLAPPTELPGEDLLCPPAHSLPEISTVDPEVVAALVDAAHDDMDVRVVGVVVVHRRPNELAPGVSFDLRHELPGEFRQVDLRPILGRDDETKLALLVRHGWAKSLRAEFLIGAVQSTGRPVALDPVPLQVGQVPCRELSPVRGRRRHVPCLDDATAAERVRRAHGNAAGLSSRSLSPRSLSGLLGCAGQPDVKRRDEIPVAAVPPPYPRPEKPITLERATVAHGCFSPSLLPIPGAGLTGGCATFPRARQTSPVNFTPSRSCSCTRSRKEE